MNRAQLRERLWDERLELPKVSVFFFLFIWPAFAVAVVLGLSDFASLSNILLQGTLIASLVYLGNVIAMVGWRKASGYVSSHLRRVIRSEVEPDNKELDRKLAEIIKDLNNKPSLTLQQREILISALNKAIERGGKNVND